MIFLRPQPTKTTRALSLCGHLVMTRTIDPHVGSVRSISSADMLRTSPGRMPREPHESADIGQQEGTRSRPPDQIVRRQPVRQVLSLWPPYDRCGRPDTVLIAMATSAGTSSSDASHVKHRLMMLTALLMVRLDQSSLIMSSRTSLSFFGPNSVTFNSRNRRSKGRRAARIVMCSPVGTPSRE